MNSNMYFMSCNGYGLNINNYIVQWSQTVYGCHQELLDSVWLAWYPRPTEIGCHNGGEFKAKFKVLFLNMEMKASLIWNPQSIAILERIQKVLQDALISADLNNMYGYWRQQQRSIWWMSIKSIICNKKRCHVTHVNSPAQLVFGQDMFMPVSANVDWGVIEKREQEHICKSNQRKNSTQINYTYSAGDRLDFNQETKNNLKTATPLFWTVQSYS